MHTQGFHLKIKIICLILYFEKLEFLKQKQLTEYNIAIAI